MQIIDKIDKHIIEKLIIDGRTSFANIAKDINLTDVAIKKRLERLKQKGIIKSIYAEIDYSIIGFLEIVDLLICVDPPKQKEILKKLKENDDVIKLIEVTGEYNYIAKIIAEDKADLKKVLDNIFSIDGIIKINTLTEIKEQKKSKNLPGKIIQTTF
ncbi:MAG: Lrp/AsnC ligand binding domain-containing protein [Candidatus ainarchaeum sp.]|nr:Lrp/AsnC ligand binding domain-containing protein [Candidatus ainarchaeum sp.]